MRARILLMIAGANVAIFLTADTAAGRWVTAGGALAAVGGALATRTRKDVTR